MDKKSVNKEIPPHEMTWGTGSGNTDTIPKIIWTFWDAQKASPLVEICFSQIRRLLPDYEFNIITKINAGNFIHDLPEIRTDISFINYTDIVRLKLISEYGGIWIDASVLLTENLDWISEIKTNEKVDFVGFFADSFTSDLDFPLIETWFFASSPQNLFIKAWMKEFEKCYRSENPHLYFDAEKKSIPNFTQKIDGPLSNYLIAYLAVAKLMRLSNDYRLHLISSSDTAHHYTFGQKIPPHRLKMYFLNNAPIYHWKLIKFEKKGREALDNDLLNGLYTKDSALFKITQNKKYLRSQPHIFLSYVQFILKNFIKNLKK